MRKLSGLKNPNRYRVGKKLGMTNIFVRNIPRTLKKEFKIQCAKNDKSMADGWTEAVELWLEKYSL